MRVAIVPSLSHAIYTLIKRLKNNMRAKGLNNSVSIYSSQLATLSTETLMYWQRIV